MRRVAWVVALVVAAAGLVVGVAHAPRHGAPSASEAIGVARADGAFVELHVKLRHAGATLAGVGDMQPLFSAPASDERAKWVRVEVPAKVVDTAWPELLRDPEVEEAFPAPEIALPARAAPQDDESCPVKTPSFESYQGYLGAAPQGIDAPAAWRRGARGQGEWFADIEGGWNAAHEDLPGDRIKHVGGKRLGEEWRAHGTAVLGEVVGRDNGKGVTGIAPDVERVFTSSIGGAPVADAIDRAANALRAGDVLLIELQGVGPRGRYLPVEYWSDCFDTISAATRRGVVVIEAAGNGAEDLDHPEYGGRFDPVERDSGAIMVGAGGPPRAGFRDRERLDFSNYGARVDVQGWGRKVATLDYGDLQRCGDAGERKDEPGPHRDYTGEFSGTSSASPIVAGAALLVEGFVRARAGAPLSPAKLRELLRQTGTPQAGDTSESIGPRPDLARALAAVER